MWESKQNAQTIKSFEKKYKEESMIIETLRSRRTKFTSYLSNLMILKTILKTVKKYAIYSAIISCADIAQKNGLKFLKMVWLRTFYVRFVETIALSFVVVFMLI